jgi:hypothetical protein
MCGTQKVTELHKFSEHPVVEGWGSFNPSTSTIVVIEEMKDL